MKKTSKIIEISGISGLIMLLFSIVCLFVGFVLFPGYLAMTLWNKASSGILGFPVLNIFQGVLLWVIVALGIYLARGAKSPIAFRTASQLDEREIVDLMARIREKAIAKRNQAMLSNKVELNDVEIFDRAEEERLKNENNKENL